MYKLAVVIGHNKKKQGANAKAPLKMSEYVFNSDIAGRMQEGGVDYDIDVKVFTRRSDVGYTKEIEIAYDEADEWGADLTIELHFNAHGTASPKGTSTLSCGTAKSLAFAAEAQEQMVRLFGREGKYNRGVKTVSREENGSWSLRAGVAPAILVEPFFGSNTADCKMMKGKEEAYARSLLSAAQNIFITMPRKHVSQSRTIRNSTVLAGVGSVSTVMGLASEFSGSLPVVQEYIGFFSANATLFVVLAGLGACAAAFFIARAYMDDRKRGLR